MGERPARRTIDSRSSPGEYEFAGLDRRLGLCLVCTESRCCGGSPAKRGCQWSLRSLNVCNMIVPSWPPASGMLCDPNWGILASRGDLHGGQCHTVAFHAAILAKDTKIMHRLQQIHAHR
jgi:hypothetical protein